MSVCVHASAGTTRLQGAPCQCCHGWEKVAGLPSKAWLLTMKAMHAGQHAFGISLSNAYSGIGTIWLAATFDAGCRLLANPCNPTRVDCLQAGTKHGSQWHNTGCQFYKRHLLQPGIASHAWVHHCPPADSLLQASQARSYMAPPSQ